MSDQSLWGIVFNSMGEGAEWFQSEETVVHSDGLQKEGLGGKEY